MLYANLIFVFRFKCPFLCNSKTTAETLVNKNNMEGGGTLVGVAGCQGESSHRVMNHFCPYFVKFTKRQYCVIVVSSCGLHTASFKEEN